MYTAIQKTNKTTFPRLDASSAVGLGAEVLMVGRREEALPEPLADALRSVEEAHAALAQADRDRLAAASVAAEDPTEARRAARASWRAFHRWLGGYVELPEGGEQGDIARRVQAALFEHGLGFLGGAPKRSWVGANQRLMVLTEHDLEEPLRGLGGGVFLERVRAAHARYGEILNMTKPSEVKPLPSIRPRLEDFRVRLQEYVLQVTAFANGRTTGAKERAERLLAPIVVWKTTKVRSRPEAVIEPATSSESPSGDAPRPADESTSPSDGGGVRSP